MHKHSKTKKKNCHLGINDKIKTEEKKTMKKSVDMPPCMKFIIL